MQFLCSVLLSSSLQFSWKVCTKHTMLKPARSKSKGLEQGAPRIYLCKGMWVLTCSYYSYCLFSLSWELWHHTELLGWGPLLRAPDALWRCVSGEVLSLFSCLLTKWRVDDQPSKPEWNLPVTDEVCFKLPISSNLYLIYLVFWHVFAAVVTFAKRWEDNIVVRLGRPVVLLVLGAHWTACLLFTLGGFRCSVGYERTTGVAFQDVRVSEAACNNSYEVYLHLGFCLLYSFMLFKLV